MSNTHSPQLLTQLDTSPPAAVDERPVGMQLSSDAGEHPVGVPLESAGRSVIVSGRDNDGNVEGAENAITDGSNCTHAGGRESKVS